MSIEIEIGDSNIGADRGGLDIFKIFWESINVKQ